MINLEVSRVSALPTELAGQMLIIGVTFVLVNNCVSNAMVFATESTDNHWGFMGN